MPVPPDPMTRRALLAAGAAMVAVPAAWLPAQDAAPSPATLPPPAAGQGEAGQLFDPSVAGKPRARSTDVDNDAYIMGVEKRLKCSCGCGLDIYTCRTTDFTCETSPRLHREIVAMRQDGKDAQAIIDAFVAEYGEQALMAPKPEGFNLLGYFLPGVAVFLAGAGLVVWFRSRRQPALQPAAAAPAPRAADGTPTPEELQKLRQALSEVDG